MSDHEQKNKNPETISWRVPEYDIHEKTKRWYLLASLVAIFFLVYAFFTANFLFALIIVVASIIFIMRSKEKSVSVKVVLNEEGAFLGKTFYDYDEFKEFSVVYKPKQKVKNLYFEFKNPLKFRLSLPLEETNPLLLRNFLLQYLKEDLDRTDEPLSEALTKLFKL